MREPDPAHDDFYELDPSGLLRGALEKTSDSWPAAGPVSWSQPSDTEVTALFPGYTDIKVLGRGGMGAVYSATQVSLDRRVAIKLLPSEFNHDPAATQRFRDEARLLAKLNHPHIVSIYDFGETAEGSFYFIMEYVDGTDLHQVIRKDKLPPMKAVEMMQQVCEALEFAHTQGFVHRDIKPANILIDQQGRVKVSDFGLAILITDRGQSLPDLEESIIGTPVYIAPEQLQGNPHVDHRADIYSLGIMFHQLLAGSLPDRTSPLKGQHTPIAQRMNHIIGRAMEENPDKRYPNISEMLQDISDALAKKKVWPDTIKFTVLLILLLTGCLIWLGQTYWPATPPATKPAVLIPQAPGTWNLDLTTKPPVLEGKWTAPEKDGGQGILSTQPFSARTFTDGTTLIHHSIKLKDQQGFATITAETLLRVSARARHKTYLQIIISTFLPTGQFAGNFELGQLFLPPNTNGEWHEIQAPLKDFLPGDITFPSLTENSMIKILYLSSYTQDTGLEVNEISLSTP